MNKEELLQKIKKLRKILNNEMLDNLPYDVAEEIQVLFEEMLKATRVEKNKKLYEIYEEENLIETIDFSEVE